MKKKLFFLVIPLGLILVSILYFSIPFTKSSESKAYKKLDKSELYNPQLNRKLITEIENSEQDSLVVLKDQQLLSSIGETDHISNVASVRKSLISALFGIAESKGLINLNSTLKDLNIDDKKNPLTSQEKQATVEDLLKSRSGIYINSIGESKSMQENRPQRGSHLPNTFYYYNNWDFNTLGVIFKQETKMTIGEAFYKWIAKPTHMKMFNPENVVYQSSEDTSIPMYRFYMCAEDLARFGSLYVNEGKWNEKQIIPKKWIDQSFSSYSTISDVDKFSGYGYLWWLDYNRTPKLQWGVGSGGQFLIIDRENKITIATMNNTGTSPVGVFLNGLLGKEGTYAKAREIHDIIIESSLK